VIFFRGSTFGAYNGGLLALFVTIVVFLRFGVTFLFVSGTRAELGRMTSCTVLRCGAVKKVGSCVLGRPRGAMRDKTSWSTLLLTRNTFSRKGFSTFGIVCVVELASSGAVCTVAVRPFSRWRKLSSEESSSSSSTTNSLLASSSVQYADSSSTDTL